MDIGYRLRHEVLQRLAYELLSTHPKQLWSIRRASVNYKDTLFVSGEDYDVRRVVEVESTLLFETRLDGAESVSVVF